MLAAAQRLSVIVTATTGLDHLDTEAVEHRRIRILSLQGGGKFLEDVRATAEHTVALILALLKHLPAAAAHVSAGGWDRDAFKGHELYGRTVGVVGYGRVGRIVARYLRAFDVRILAADPHARAEALDPGVWLVPLPELLAASHFVTLHVNLSASTQGFFGREQFAQMLPGAWFINTSRGDLVDERGLLEALRSGRLAGAAVDVLSGESAAGMAHHPLVAYAREHENLLVTPHIGGCTAESMEKTELFLARQLGAMLPELFRPAPAESLTRP